MSRSIMRRNLGETPASAKGVFLLFAAAGYSAEQNAGVLISTLGTCMWHLMLDTVFYRGDGPSRNTEKHLLASTAGLVVGAGVGLVQDTISYGFSLGNG
jgi:hypothetical protein